MEAFKYYMLNNFDRDLLSLLETNSIISITDSLGRIEYVNDNFCNTLECDERELLGETLKLLKSPLHSDLLYKKLWKTIKSGRKWNGVLEASSLNGNTLWLDATIVPVKKENAFKYVTIYKDITAHHSKSIGLLENDEKYKAFLNEIPMNVFSISKYGKVLNANKSFYNLSINDLVDTYIYDYINPSCYNTFKNNIDAAFLDKSTKQFEFYDFDLSGNKICYQALVSPVFNTIGALVSATVCINDITDFQNIDKKELNNEFKYQTIYQSINVGIIVVADHKGSITEWNKGAELAFGYSETEILGRPLTILTTEQYKKPNIKELANAIKKIKNNQNADIIEMQCLRKNGEEFPVEFALSKLNIENEVHYCAMMLDISKRKSLQNKLKRKTNDLELFLYRSAHDLKAPFSSAQGLINLLKEEITNKKSANLLEMLEATIESGRVLSDNLAEASSISAKKYEYKRINFDQCIDDVIKTLSGSRNFEYVKFNININVTKPFKSKPELIKSIFQNLIQNAIKYSKEPSENHAPTIDVSVETKEDNLVISICDNGLGISEKNINKIFDLYYRANDANVPGNGLGLYIVKSIIEGLEGEISVRSDFNDGAYFEIRLPNS